MFDRYGSTGRSEHSSEHSSEHRRHLRVAGILAGRLGLILNLVLATSAGADRSGAATPGQRLQAIVAAGLRLHPSATIPGLRPADRRRAGSGAHVDAQPSCTFNGVTDVVPDVVPGSAVAISCSGWAADAPIAAAEVSPLALSSDSGADIDPNIQTFTADGNGGLTASFTVPDPFVAPDPNAVCPPTSAQVAQGDPWCGLVLIDTNDPNSGTAVLLDYASSPLSPPPPPPSGSATAVGMASNPDGGGYWLAWSNGDVTVHGDAQSYGNASQLPLNEPITHIVATPDGNGYWLVASDGGTFAFGDAGFYGSMGGRHLNQPVVDMAPTPDGRGYWLVASDGGIFAFGDARFLGSMGGEALNSPVVGLSADPTGGYWEVASDGGIFAFGAPFFGSTGAIHLNQPVNGMAPTPDGSGYWFVSSDGGIFAFGDAGFSGSMGGAALAAPVVGMAADDATGGYWLVASDGGIFSFRAPFLGAS
jgi:hypothetical protein